MSKYHDDTTVASDPVAVRLARRRLAAWPRAESVLSRIARWIGGDEFAERIDEHLRLGDSRAAVVINCSPLLVAAYTDELDCVALLRFPVHFVDQFHLDVGTRLLTVNTYGTRAAVAADLIPGSGDQLRWQYFYPLIAEFLSDDSERIATRKAQITEAEWERCFALGRDYVRARPGVARDGSPFESFKPAGRVAFAE